MNTSEERATLGGGCFWCTEAVFKELKGVDRVVPGYIGGDAPGIPTYREVCSGLTGHAEAIEVYFDPSVIKYEDILTIFMTTHDPTTLNRQGGDVGTQYRSVIFFHSDKQKEIAEMAIKELSAYFDDPIVTEISEASTFYVAEDHHHDYYNQNKEQGYCNAVISPKLTKFRKVYASFLK
ncbi:MAG: peptide-methionine (S)-S-oxide reductase MsrA [Eudoraea sp.]|nr:peptide-methionine (S)-S-oxide reductase MsrA [Eudoraea sp.]